MRAPYVAERRYQQVRVGFNNVDEPFIRLQEQPGVQKDERLRQTVYTEGWYVDETSFGHKIEAHFAEDTLGHQPLAGP